MSFTDSMFLFEIVVEDLKSFIARQKFSIRSQFANVFNVNLKDPNDTQLAHVLPKQINKLKKKVTIRNAQTANKKEPPAKVQTGQSILFASNIHTLVSMMRQFPMELSLCEKDDPRNRLGSTQIGWSPAFSEYLEKITIKQNPAPAFVSGGYHVFDEYTSKRMATIRLNVKLTYLTDKISYAFRSLSEDNQKTFMYTGFNSKATTILSTIKDAPINWEEETGKIKTIYRGDRRSRPTKNKKPVTIATKHEMSKDETCVLESELDVTESIKYLEQNGDQQNSTDPLINFKIPKDTINPNLVKSETNLDKSKQTSVFKSKSCSSVKRDQYKILNYIFGDNQGPFGNQVYCVNYFTVENDPNKGSTSTVIESAKESPGSPGSPDSPDKSEECSKAKYKFKVCDYKKEDGTHCNESFCSLDLPAEAADMITVTKCKHVECDNRTHKKVPEPPDDRLLLDLGNLHPQPCCETIEQVVGGMTAKVKYDEKQDECYCECECTFGFVKKTTYCGVCGGFETPGEDFTQKLPDVPYPCPIYHKLVDKNKLKTISTSGSDTKNSKSLKGGKKSDKSPGSEKDSKKGKKKKDDRFKFNYGYTAPQIGHGECAMPCSGTLGAVPRSMGWLWTAEDVPALNFRPMWKPGAINKHVARLLRMAKNPGEVITKKKRKPDNKRPLKRPLIMVHKKDGEYTITMEPMKTFQKPRLVNQYPYEDQPVLTYTIGRTEAENYERQKKKEREKRRLERDQRDFIQSAFRDMCSEICMKTYQQALGILPGAEDPDCTCFPKHPGPEDANLDLSCSCSEDNDSIGSDTDSDEWIVEFTPPNATFDPTFKPKKVVKADNTSQYTYLDYRVKLFDRSGKPIVRFFKGPDGKNQCSDLGGFWGPDKKWLEINVDGYIAPDDRWAPMNFIGPGGELIEADTGKFQTANGRWFEVGIDGYVDCHGRWKCYARPRPGGSPKPNRKMDGGKKGPNKKPDKQVPAQPSADASWSCLGDASPVQLSKIGIVGHGHDKKILLEALQKLKAQGADVTIPKPSTVFRLPSSRKRRKLSPREIDASLAERTKCRHPVPSDKGVVAIDDSGNKAYFKMKPPKNRRPNERRAALIKQGISVSSFHSPCFQSFINKEMLKQQQQEEHDRGVRTAGTQVGF